MKTLAKILPIFMVLLPLAASAETSVYESPNGQVKVEVGGGASGSSQEGGAGAAVQTGATVQGKSDDNIGSQGNDGVGVEVHSSDSDEAEVEMHTQNDDSMEAEISGDPDFDLLVKSVKEEDANVASADVDADGAVQVEYKHKAHLFGFIPVTLNSKTNVSSDVDGNAVVKVTLPWWSFLFSDASDIKTAIETSLADDAELNAVVTAREQGSGMATGRRTHTLGAIVSALAKVKGNASYDLKMMTK